MAYAIEFVKQTVGLEHTHEINAQIRAAEIETFETYLE